MSETNEVVQAQEAYAAACKEHVAATKASFAIEMQIERLQQEAKAAAERRQSARMAMRTAEEALTSAVREANHVESLAGMPGWMAW